MAAHRYWRLMFTRNAGGNAVSIGEMILATTPAGAQAATGGTASASTVNSTNVAANAFDGTTSAANFWRSVSGGFVSNVGNEYLQYDMGVGNSLDPVELRLYFNGTTAGTTTYPVNFVLLYSDDALGWTVKSAWSEQVFTNPETKTLSLTAPTIVNRVVLIRTARYNAAAHSGSPTLRKVYMCAINMAVHASRPAHSTPWSGSYYIAGSTTVLGVQASRLVRVVDQRSGLLVRTFHTGADGIFLISGLAYAPYSVIGVDTTGAQNSVIFAHVMPTIMP